MSDIPDRPIAAEVRQLDQKAALRAGYELTKQTHEEGNKSPLGLALPSLGVVAHFDAPTNWKKYYGGGQQPYMCCPEHVDSVIVEFKHTAMPVGAENRGQVERLLNADHTLSASEISWLQKLLNTNSSDRVTLSSAKSHEINGERIIDVTGKLTVANSTVEFRSIYIDVDWTAKYLQQITYSAPAEKFQKYYAPADGLFKSLVFTAECPPFRNRPTQKQ